jgi:hypothetical protein
MIHGQKDEKSLCWQHAHEGSAQHAFTYGARLNTHASPYSTCRTASCMALSTEGRPLCLHSFRSLSPPSLRRHPQETHACDVQGIGLTLTRRIS